MAPLVAAPPKHLLQVADFDRGQLEELLGLATRMKTDALGWRNAHAGQTLACVFGKPSPRTRLSLAVAAQRLGMLPLTLRSDELRLGYVDAIAVAGLAQVEVQRLSAAAAVPVINAGSDDHHPCQALAGLLTVRERFGRIEGLKLAYAGGALNIAHSLMQASALFGMDFTMANAAGCRPQAEVLIRAHALAERCGGSVDLVAGPEVAVKGANVVYTDAGLEVTADLMARAAHDAILMQRRPAQSGCEVATQQALIHTLIHGWTSGV